MPSGVSNFKAAHKVFAVEPLHVDLRKTPIGASAILLPVEDLSIDQTFNPEYTAADVYGRMDPIVTYKHTRRSLSIRFKCQAHHIIDGAQGVINNIRNINLLTQLLYPAYFEGGGGLTSLTPRLGLSANGEPLAVLGAPPFFRIRYGNYIGSFLSTGDFVGEDATGLTGYIQGFSHNLGEVAQNVAFGKSEGDPGFRALPREIAVRFSFKVIHDKLVGWYNDRFSSPNGQGYGYNFPYNAGESGPTTYSYHRSAPPRAGGVLETPTVSVGSGVSDTIDSATARENDPAGVHAGQQAASQKSLLAGPHSPKELA